MFYRGGNYNDNDNAGVFYYNGNNSRSNANDNLGFRSALLSIVRYYILTGIFSVQRGKGVYSHSLSYCKDGKKIEFPRRYLVGSRLEIYHTWTCEEAL